ncbi:hypothetical protein [Azospirillum halopraeferens]|uniref:hypothetical protein n=1 Tax=Azospirillum halopraeferens TaxID=34010 RepID=UPI0004280939|nr:hypothetical protein [Azospirillum halopraeferens]
MNAETGTEAESPKRRGRIPQSAWPRILERYRAGATLSAIAREFECTPSAISYIVRKAEASGQGGEETGEPAADAAPAETAPSEAAPPATDAPEAQAPAGEPARPDAEPAAEADPAPQPPRHARGGEPRPERSRGESARGGTLRADQLRGDRSSRGEPAVAPVVEPAPAAPAPLPAAPVAVAPAAAPAGGEQAAPRPARAEPTPPVDAVEARLRETARTCLAAYRTWRQQPGENSIQPLSDAVHELRKALARIEIDMSASRREEQVARPIPIPAHRAARRAP